MLVRAWEKDLKEDMFRRFMSWCYSDSPTGFRVPHPELCSLDHPQWDRTRIIIKWFE